MAISGFKRYLKLIKNVENPWEYFLNKGKRHKKNLIFTTRPNKISFDVSSGIYLVFKEIFMSDVYNIDELLTKIPGKPVIVDIGANVGFFDMLILSKLPGATIYAYEPLPVNIAKLNKIISENPQIKNAISVYQRAVTGKSKEALELFMEDTDDSQVVASVFSDFNKNNTKKISVPSITLTEIVTGNKLEQIDLLKIDCEGSEYDIIYNTDPAIIKRAKFIALEIHDIDEKNNFNEMKKYLTSLGYQLTAEPINDFCYAVEAIRQ